MKKIKLTIFLILGLLVTPNLCSADKVQLTTYIPAPFGVYSQLRLIPRTTEPYACIPTQLGSIYYNGNNNEIRQCSPGNVWETISVWEQVGNFVYPKSTLANSDLKIGLGTTSPVFPLHIVDGGVYIEGMDNIIKYDIYSGADPLHPWPSLSTTVPPIPTPPIPNIGYKSHMIFYPPMSIFRAGLFTDEGLWDSSGIADGVNATDTSLWGAWSIGMGVNPRAEGWHSIAIGEHAHSATVTAGLLGGVAIGKESFASDGSIAIGGLGADARGRSYTIGNQSAADVNSIAIGYRLSADNESTLIGSNSTADNSVVIGYNNNITYGTVIGHHNNYTGTSNTNGDSVIIGTSSNITSSEAGAAIVGSTNTVRGNKGVVVGYSSEADGYNSVALGRDAIAHSYESVAIGYNSIAGTAGFSGGTGAGAAAQVAFDDYRGSVAIGAGAEARRTGSIAIGRDTKSYAKYAIALGDSAVAGDITDGSGENAIAFGANMTVTGENSIGISTTTGGSFTVAQDNSMAIISGTVSFNEPSPQALVHIDGQLGLGNDGTVCDASTEGAFYYDSGTSLMYFCDDAGVWKKILPQTLRPSNVRGGISADGNAGGYDGLKSNCLSTEHVCTAPEITRYLQDANLALSGWIISNDGDNDCDGFTSTTGSGMIAQAGTDQITTAACNAPRSVLCCEH